MKVQPRSNIASSDSRRRSRAVAFFGHFGLGNLGNESTLQAVLYHLRSRLPDAEFTCICTDPEATKATHNLAAVPVNPVLVRSWRPRNRMLRLLRSFFVGVPNELYRWLAAFARLRNTDVLIVPGTGVLTDAFGIGNWGPYGLFRWCVTAKLCGCRLLFISVGAGPIYTRAGRFFARTALRLADFRSWRDESSMQYLKGMGFPADRDPVYPDLAFSLSSAQMPLDSTGKRRRPVVGIGLMEYAGRYSVENPRASTYSAYMQALLKFAKWLLARGYDIRLLIGDLTDRKVTEEFRGLLRDEAGVPDDDRVIDEPIETVEDLLAQLAATDLVVATRFHNVLLSLLLSKPVIAILFHHKCASLMNQIGMADYCQDINTLNAEKLIEQFRQLRKHASEIKHTVDQNVEASRGALDEQYELILSHICPGRQLTRPEMIRIRDAAAGSGELRKIGHGASN